MEWRLLSSLFPLAEHIEPGDGANSLTEPIDGEHPSNKCGRLGVAAGS